MDLKCLPVNYHCVLTKLLHKFFPKLCMNMETQWKGADDKTKLSVLGYTRRIMNKLKGWNVPLSIQYYCISYYYLTDYFTEHGDNITINDDGNIAKGKTKRHRRNTVYGNEIIDFDSIDKNSKHVWKWRFQISQLNCDSPGFWIGINDADPKILNDAVMNYGDISHSYLCTNKGRVLIHGGNQENVIAWNSNAIIEMKVTGFRHGYFGSEMSFKIDSGGNTGTKLFEYIEEGKYSLAVVISEQGQKIEILDFEHIISPTD